MSLEWKRDEVIWYIEGRSVAQQTLLRDFWSGVGTNPYTDIRYVASASFPFYHTVVDHMARKKV